ncbi:MAG: hypothetical protein MK171_09700 [Pirellulales bacterium]|nr:hypothetical protein [Pirellulales bacterium]
MTALIAKRLSCLTKLRDLGCKQSDLVTAGAISDLLRLIAAKNQLFVMLQAVEQQLTPYHADEPENRQWESSEQRTHCATQVSASTQLLEEVMQLERDNEKKMVRRRDALAGQFQAAHATSAAHTAYRTQQQPWSESSSRAAAELRSNNGVITS